MAHEHHDHHEPQQNEIAGPVVFALMAWTLASKAVDAASFSEVSQGLNVPRAPLYGWMAVCAALSALAAVYTAFAAPMSVAHDQEEVL